MSLNVSKPRKKALCCQRCGTEYERNPILAVPCPRCHAKVGSPCKRPSEHGAAEPHKERREASWIANPCEGCLEQYYAERARARKRFTEMAERFPALWESGEQELQRRGWEHAA